MMRVVLGLILLALLTAAPVGAQNITGLTPAGYQVANLVVGSNYYTDRTYTLTSIPAAVAGGQFIMTANNDKNFTGATHVQFTVDAPARVYVAFDSRTTALPAWMSAWTITPDSIGTTDVALRLYVRDYASPGQITLGGNLQSPSDAQTHYIAVVKPLGGAPPTWANPNFTMALTKETGSALNLSWTDMSDNEDTFEVERRAPGGTFSLLISLPANAQTHRDATVASGATWCYRVRAVNTAGPSGYSNEACGTAQ